VDLQAALAEVRRLTNSQEDSEHDLDLPF
jgi:hypothetical protein